MGLMAIDIQCVVEECGHRWDDLVERSERDGPFTCPRCGSGLARRVFSAPMVLKAIFPSGYRAKNDANFKHALEANQLKVESSEKGSDPKRDKEIRRLGGDVE